MRVVNEGLVIFNDHDAGPLSHVLESDETREEMFDGMKHYAETREPKALEAVDVASKVYMGAMRETFHSIIKEPGIPLDEKGQMLSIILFSEDDKRSGFFAALSASDVFIPSEDQSEERDYYSALLLRYEDDEVLQMMYDRLARKMTDDRQKLINLLPPRAPRPEPKIQPNLVKLSLGVGVLIGASLAIRHTIKHRK